jgi:serine/threonine protein kinase
MAPEILAKRVTDRSKVDIWALGVTFAYMIEGRLPWPSVRGTTEAIMRGHYVISRKVPRPLLDILNHMLMLNPAERWSAQQLLAHPYLCAHEKPKGISPAATLPYMPVRPDMKVRLAGMYFSNPQRRSKMGGSPSMMGLTFAIGSMKTEEKEETSARPKVSNCTGV